MNENQRWYYAVDEQTLGPFSTAEIVNLIQRSVILASSWIVVEGTEHWMSAQDSPFNEYFLNAYHLSEEQDDRFSSPDPDRVPEIQNLPAAPSSTVLPSQDIETRPLGVVSDLKSEIVARLYRLYVSSRKSVIIISVVFTILGCAAIGSLLSSKHSRAEVNPEQQFLRFQTMANGIKAPASDGVGQLKSGMTASEATAVLDTVEITDSFASSRQYAFLLKEHIFDITLETGDKLKSIVLKRPSELPSDIACVALAFFDDGLYRVTYIYDQQELMRVEPKEQKYANSSDRWEADKLDKIWNLLLTQTLAAVAQKYTPVTLKFVNFFGQPSNPELLAPDRDSAGDVLFHGLSQSALAHVTYVTQDQHSIGVNDPNFTVETH